jgi:hypothetical protein
MAWSETSGLHAQSTTRGYLLYRCVHQSGQRWALISLARMLRLLNLIPVVNEPRHLLALLRQQHLCNVMFARPPKQLRQLWYVGSDAPRFVTC